MITFPPSPAISDCDSLAGIEDLDAFLEAQGQLSHFPTPPLGKEDIIIEEGDIDGEDEEPRVEYRHIAAVMSQKASMGISTSSGDIELVESILIRAQLPPEILGTAYNILFRLATIELPVDWTYSTPVDLMVASSLFLVNSYTNDRPPSLSCWSRSICDCRWTAKRIDGTMLQIMAALDWRLHDLCSPHAIQDAMADLERPAEMYQPAVGPNVLGKKLELHTKLGVDISTANWVHGQLTPEATPPSSAFGNFGESFLPLL